MLIETLSYRHPAEQATVFDIYSIFVDMLYVQFVLQYVTILVPVNTDVRRDDVEEG
jgi:hypothetical protein